LLAVNISKNQANQWIERKPWKCGSAPLLGVATSLCSLLFRIPGTTYSFIRLRQNTPQLVGAKRRSRLRGCAELHCLCSFAPRHFSFISGVENLQREDLSAIEAIEGVVEIVDGELIEDQEYALLGRKPADRVKSLLGKLDPMRRSKEQEYEVATQARLTSHKFVGSIEKIFKNLPKPLQWRSFFNHDLPLLMDLCEEVQEISIQHRHWPRPGL